MNGDDLGLIRPEHARDGWRLDADNTGWGLTKPLPDGGRARIRPTTPTTVSWSVYAPNGHMLREASGRDVEAAKSAAVQWYPGQETDDLDR